MKVQIENSGPFEKKLCFEIPGDVVTQEVDSSYKELNRSAKIRGFRPGKVPRSILERYYKTQVEEEVLSKLINDSFGKAVEEHHLFPVSPPTLVERKFEAGKELKYTLTVEVKPEIIVEGYTGLEVVREKVIVTEEEIEARLKDLQEGHAQMKPLDVSRPIQEKDCVILDFEGNLDGKLLKDWKVNDHLVEVGSKSLVGELDMRLVGLSVHEEKDIPIRLPETYSKKELAGKEITVHVKVKEIKEKILPKLDDEFAKDVGTFNSLTELRNQTRQTLEQQKQARADQAAKEKLLDILIAKQSVALPKGMVDRQVQNMINRTRLRFAGQGLKLDDAKIDPQKLKESFQPAAEKEIAGTLILEKVAEAEKMNVESAEMDQRFTQMAAQMNQRVEAVKAYYEKEGLVEGLRTQMLEEKALDFLLRQAKVVEVEGLPEKNPAEDKQ